MGLRLKLKGPAEKDIQAWILASLGTEQKELRTDKNGRDYWVSLNTWTAPGVVLHRSNSAVLRTPSGGFIRAGAPGMADITGVAYGRPVALEVKVPGGKQSPEQKRWEAWWVAAGGVYAVVTSPSEARKVLAKVRVFGDK